MPDQAGDGGGVTMPQQLPAMDNLLRTYLSQEGIDRRYSHLIMRELHEATELTDDQLNKAASELITGSQSNTEAPPTPVANINPNVDFRNSHVWEDEKLQQKSYFIWIYAYFLDYFAVYLLIFIRMFLHFYIFLLFLESFNTKLFIFLIKLD